MKKRRIRVSDASPDMIIGEDVYTFGGQNIMSEGTILTNKLITRLRFYSIVEICIQVPESRVDYLEIEECEKKALTLQEKELQKYAEENKAKSKKSGEPGDKYVELIKNTSEYRYFNTEVYESAMLLEDSLSAFITKEGRDLDTNELLNQTKEIIIMNKNPMNTFHTLQSIRAYDDATYIHSLNVAIICNLFGKWLKMSQEDLDILTLSGLLHDIGKMEIPSKIIKKPEILTDEEYSIVKLHPKRGYNMLEPMRIDERIKRAALMHHERCDGSGYPNGLKGDEIDEFAKIVSIADIFDAMTSARVYRGPLCPFEVISIFELEGYSKFEPKYIIPFLEGIVNYYLQEDVVLSDGRIGRIVMNNKNALSRPVVRVGNQLVDLSREKDLTIVKLV